MKVFVAAGPGDRMRPEDFNWTVDGELVSLPIARCDCPGCGCDRAVDGLASARATTTFQVIDNPALDAAGYVAAFSEALQRQGWIDEGDDDGWLTAWAAEHLRLAAGFSPGQILEIHDGRVRAR